MSKESNERGWLARALDRSRAALKGIVSPREGVQPDRGAFAGEADEEYPDSLILDILNRARTIAMVGASPHWNRPSYFAMKYLQAKGYRVIPVNPEAAAAGETILGERAYPDLGSIPEKVDVVDVFRRPEAVPAIAEAAIAVGATVLWMQLGIRHPEAAARARAAGLAVVMNRCMKFEYGRYFGEMGWAGFNTRVISSRRRRVRA